MESFWRDVRHAWRSLWRTPTVTLAAALSLALGVGVNTAIYSVIRATLMRPLALPEVDRLVVLSRTVNARPSEFTDTEATAIREGVLGVADLGVHAWSTGVAGFDSGREFTSIQFAGSNWSEVIGLAPAYGRWFTAQEERRGSRVALINDWSWRNRFRGDPGVVGTMLRVNGIQLSIIGILPPTFTLDAGVQESDEVTVPLTLYAALKAAADPQPGHLAQAVPSESDGLRLTARLRAGVAPSTLHRRLSAIATGFETRRARPGEPARVTVSTVEAATAAVPPWARATIARVLSLLAGVSGLVMLLGCTSVAAVLLARGEERRRETAIRSALGAARGRLIRELLVEATMLSGLAAGAGALLSLVCLRIFAAVTLADTIRVGSLDTAPEATTLVFVASLALLVILASALGPAVWGSRVDLAEITRVGGVARCQSRRAQMGLLAGQVAISFMLVCGAALLGRSLYRGLTADLGFREDRLAQLTYDLDPATWTRAAHRRFRRELVSRVEHLPGVVAAGIGEPPLITFDQEQAFEVDGARQAHGAGQAARVVHIDPEYRRVLDLPLLAGRDLMESDNEPGAIPAALVNRAFAARYLYGRSPVGHTFRRASDTSRVDVTIVGVVGNTRFTDLRSMDGPTVYVPREHDSDYPLGGTLVIRTAGEPHLLTDAVRRAFQELAPNDPPPSGMTTVAEWRAGMFEGQRTGAELLAWLGGVGLALAVLGVAGSVLYAVERRRTEFGVRAAVGATPGALVRQAMWIGLRPVVAGIGAGTLLTLYAARFAEPFLFEITSSDTLSFCCAGAVLLLAGFLASWLPGRRVAAIDPAKALRAE